MNVLSLFDGMSCGQIALNRSGIKYKNYYASEIDKHAIKVTMANYPNTIQLGSVVDVDINLLPKIDLLIGGSPCQGFSFTGKMKGMSTSCDHQITTLDEYLELKFLGFEFDGQSYLFWEYVRILAELKTENPSIRFFLENVKMQKNWENIISETLGVQPILINSSLVSAQNRERLYWTNIEGIGMPVDLKMTGEDYNLFGDAEDKSRPYMGEITWRKSGKILEQLGFYGKNRNSEKVFGLKKKLPCLTKLIGVRLWLSTDEINTYGACINFCEWLQTVPKNYTAAASLNQRYSMLGNGWTVDVIAHFFEGLKK